MTQETLQFEQVDSRQDQASRILCAISGCSRPRRSREWCQHHYNNWYRRGDPLSIGRIGREPRHGFAGKKKSVEWETWRKMRQRCYLKSRKDFARYGGRGITVCERWKKFENFIADMGLKPSPQYSLERKDNDLGYSPQNCKWALPIEQANNRGNSRILEHDGQKLTIMQWARRLGFCYSTIHRRLKKGWSVNDALERRPRPQRNNYAINQ